MLMTEGEMVGWYHQLNGHEFAQAPGVGDGQGSLMCCSPWGHKESSPTPQFKSINFLALSFLYGPTLTSYTTTGKTIALTIWISESK